MIIEELQLHQPDDMHLHLRDGKILSSVLPYSSQVFGRAIIMPNLDPPVTTTLMAKDYQNRILGNLDNSSNFQPLMTLYLTETTRPNDIEKGVEDQVIKAVKLYPAGATTNSDFGVRDFGRVMRVLEKMAALKLPLLVHGEVADPSVDIFDREAVFIDRILDPLIRELPELRIVMEHITTKTAVDYVTASKVNLKATITPHHIVFNRNAIFDNGINPHNYCLPILKKEKHRLAVKMAAISGSPKFFLGTDSAPHFTDLKETSCGCAGIFNSINALGTLATIFEKEGRLYNLEKFVSINGSNFYGFKPNKLKIKLVKKLRPVTVPEYIKVGRKKIKVFDPGFDIFWHVKV